MFQRQLSVESNQAVSLGLGFLGFEIWLSSLISR